MATWRICDKCGTGKDDKTVDVVRVSIDLNRLDSEDCHEWIRDLCGKHRAELKRWIDEVIDAPVVKE